MLEIKYYMLAILIIYIPFHLFEEALGDFPKWMYEHGYTKETKISYAFWMAGNIFFYYPFLLFCVIAYVYFGDKFIFMGTGVLFWGIINFLEHFIFTIKDKKISPGVYTSVLFMITGVLAIIELIKLEYLTFLTILLSIVVALVCALVPILLQIHVGNRLWKRFDENKHEEIKK